MLEESRVVVHCVSDWLASARSLASRYLDLIMDGDDEDVLLFLAHLGYRILCDSLIGDDTHA